MSLGKATRLLLLTALFVPGLTFAQTSMGTVNGTVTDSTGATVPGATVTLVNEATNVQAVRHTGDDGYFVFVNVRPGPYNLTVELSGLKSVRMATFNVGVNETVPRNVTLEVGAVTETVEVIGQSELLQASTAELGNVIEEKVIKELPIQGRNFTQLLLLTPGVNPVSTSQGAQQDLGFGTAEGSNGLPGSAFNNASVQGQQNRSKIYYMDGIVNTSIRAGSYVALPDLDSLQEFKVQSHSDKAEFGGVTGGVINMTTKSGSNQFRGSVFGFYRNEGFTARDPYRDVQGSEILEPPDFRQGQFGANVGGPIIKDKTFFFAAYDGWRYKDFANIRHTVPTAAELNGDFSQSHHGRTIYNPYTTRIENGRLVRDPFPGNVIPANLISPAMQQFLQAYMVRPNISGNVRDNYQDRRERYNNANAFQLRLDHHFSTKDNVFLRYTERRIDQLNPVGDVAFREPDSKNRNWGGGWFHTFSPSLILEVRGGKADQPTADAPLTHPAGVGPQAGLPELDRFFAYFIAGGDFNPTWSLPDLGMQGPRPRNNPNWNIAADLTWLKGKHNIKLGFQRLQIDRLQRNQFGDLDFSAEATRNPQSTGNTGDALASALLGLPSRIQGNVFDFGFIDFHTETYSGYIQDQWSIKPTLTLTYGVRYDYITRAAGAGLQSGPDMDTGEWLIALPQLPPVCSTVGNVPPCLPRPVDQIPFGQFIRATGEEFSILPTIKDNIGPRVGLAWQMNPKTVLRTGYSLMWDSMVSRSQYGQHQFETWGWPQFSGIDTGTGLNREGGPITRVENVGALPFGVPRGDPWTSGGWFNNPDRKNAYSHQWHVEVQREITRNLMVAVGYVGSHNGRLEYAGRAQSPPAPAIAPDGRRLTPAERDQLRPWPHIQGDFRYEDSIGWANYHALQFKIQRRFAGGLATNLSYTLSRAKDTSSGWFNTENGVGGNAAAQNFHDIDAAYGLAGYDVPHILTWGGIWELPVGPKEGGLSWLVGNWQLNWNLLARSGQPMTIQAGGDPANIGFNGYSQADLVGDPDVSDPNPDQWFNTAAFANPVNNFGNSGRNILRAPAYWIVDLGLQKNIPMGQQRSLQLRVDLFNVFNHINDDPPNIDVGNANFGRITGIWSTPRQLEVGARFIF
jgi:hypothetical protein